MISDDLLGVSRSSMTAFCRITVCAVVFFTTYDLTVRADPPDNSAGMKRAVSSAGKSLDKVSDSLSPPRIRCTDAEGNLSTDQTWGAPEVDPVFCSTESPIPLFQSQEPLDLSIEADFGALNENTTEERSSEGKLKYDSSGIESNRIKIKVEARGQSRREYCGMKPLKLKPKGNLSGTIFEGSQHALKLVTHCEATLDPGKQSPANRRVLREYALYRSLDALGTTSFKTRLAQIKYRNSDGQPVAEGYGILIENKDDMAKRCGMKAVDSDRIPDVHPTLDSKNQIMFDLVKQLFLDDDHAADFHLNSTLLEKNGRAKAAVPYDFDMSGLVRDAGGISGAIKPWDGTTNDGPWLRKYIANPPAAYKGREREWKAAVVANLTYMADHQVEIHDALAKIPLHESDRQKIISRYKAFFAAIKR